MRSAIPASATDDRAKRRRSPPPRDRQVGQRPRTNVNQHAACEILVHRWMDGRTLVVVVPTRNKTSRSLSPTRTVFLIIPAACHLPWLARCSSNEIGDSGACRLQRIEQRRLCSRYASSTACRPPVQRHRPSFRHRLHLVAARHQRRVRRQSVPAGCPTPSPSSPPSRRSAPMAATPASPSRPIRFIRSSFSGSTPTTRRRPG